MVWRREIVFVKIGRSLRFDVKDLEQMIEQARVRPAKETRETGALTGNEKHGRL
jgi:hypothetical protein